MQPDFYEKRNAIVDNAGGSRSKVSRSQASCRERGERPALLFRVIAEASRICTLCFKTVNALAGKYSGEIFQKACDRSRNHACPWLEFPSAALFRPWQRYMHLQDQGRGRQTLSAIPSSAAHFAPIQNQRQDRRPPTFAVAALDFPKDRQPRSEQVRKSTAVHAPEGSGPNCNAGLFYSKRRPENRYQRLEACRLATSVRTRSLVSVDSSGGNPSKAGRNAALSLRRPRVEAGSVFFSSRWASFRYKTFCFCTDRDITAASISESVFTAAKIRES